MKKAFERIQEKTIREIRTTARLYRHRGTGAEVASLCNEDENKVFGITFRTPPGDSTGIAHILEHAVLCGSRKYPVKEPFVELVKGSLHTFLNAFTYPDKTCYPVASQHPKDFYNLIDVYLDAVFHPLLTEDTLRQEGWHYDVKADDQPFAFKGVVFNEMKGVYSSPDSMLREYSQQCLFPGHTYGLDSGGNPEVIPDLDYHSFRTFHQTMYHPSNARIWFYGDDPEDKRLEILHAYLQDFDMQGVASQIPPFPGMAAPAHVERTFASGDMDAQARTSMLTVNWLLPDTRCTTTVLALKILEHILVETPASPLKQALIDSGLGEDMAGVGLETELRQMYFSTGLKGIRCSDAQTVEALILDTLQKIAGQGIDRAMIDASIHTIAFQLRENNSGQMPRGLVLMLRSLASWLYDGDPFDPLCFETPLNTIKQAIGQQSGYFEALIDGHLIQNPSRVTLLLKPDKNHEKERERRERERLDQARARADAARIRKLVEETTHLRKLQQTPDAPEKLAAIPRLTIRDLDTTIRTIPCASTDVQHTRVLYHGIPTNDICYVDLGFDLHALPQDLLPYASLLGTLFLEMGTTKEDYIKLTRRIGRQTGGMDVQTWSADKREGPDAACRLFLRSKAMVGHFRDLLDIFHDILLDVRLDNRSRLRQILLEEKASEEESLIPSGHRVVDMRLHAGFSEAGWAADQMAGIAYLDFLRNLEKAMDTRWDEVLDKFMQVQRTLVNRQAMLINITADAEHRQTLERMTRDFIAQLPAHAATTTAWAPRLNTASEGLLIPAQVNYVGKGLNLYAHGYTLHGSILVIKKYLGTTWLWDRIRVQGGAYGGFATFDHRSGIFNFLSYRDPNLQETLAVYDQSARFLQEGTVDKSELSKTIIGTIGDLDAYMLPDAQGYTSLIRTLTGDTDAFRQRIRNEVLGTTQDDFHRFGSLLEQFASRGRTVVLGARRAVEAHAANSEQDVQLRKVLG